MRKKKIKILHKKSLIFCIFRFGNSFINGNTIFDRICSIPFRIIMKLTYNKYNHIPLETNIGGGKNTPSSRNCFVGQSVNW